MEYNAKNKFKDASPYETINRIRNILYKFNITVKESWNSELTDGVYSVRIEIINTKIGTNGKGTTEIYALASAYAELIERITNCLLFPNWRTIGTELFTFFPDEEKVEIAEYYKTNPISDAIFKQLSTEKNEQVKLIQELCSEENKIMSIYFEDLLSGERFPIACKLVEDLYGSNGMAAGNTYEEALVQAISEIFERYCLKQIISQELSPPDIPRDIIQKCYPEIYDYILRIEAKDNYLVRIRDCSLGLSFPVICTTIFDKEQQISCTNMGAHPDITIALERSFTELFQGRRLGESWGSFSRQEDWNIFSQDENVKKCNIMSLINNSGGYYPDKFYSQKYSYALNFDLFKQKFCSNAEMLTYLSDLCKRNEFRIFVRKSNKLGFPTVYVIIPGISEVWSYDKEAYNTSFAFKQVTDMINNIEQYPKDVIENTLELVDISRKFLIVEPFFKEWGEMVFPGIYNFCLLLINTYYQIGALDKAIVFTYSLMTSNLPNNSRKLLKCLVNTLEIIRRGICDKSTIHEILSNFYREEIVTNALSIVLDKKPNLCNNIKTNTLNYSKIEKSIVMDLKKYMFSETK